ncbi:hypothetical protein M1555_03015 [Patescibacteria group bacterium]|nr:hypothetical protein [Patescibacteria group bacterium]
MTHPEFRSLHLDSEMDALSDMGEYPGIYYTFTHKGEQVSMLFYRDPDKQEYVLRSLRHEGTGIPPLREYTHYDLARFVWVVRGAAEREDYFVEYADTLQEWLFSNLETILLDHQ